MLNGLEKIMSSLCLMVHWLNTLVVRTSRICKSLLSETVVSYIGKVVEKGRGNGSNRAVALCQRSLMTHMTSMGL